MILPSPEDLEAVESFVKDLQRKNWEFEGDAVDLLPLYKEIFDRRKRTEKLETILLNGMREKKVSSARLEELKSPESLLEFAGTLAHFQAETALDILWRLVENFGHDWTVSDLSYPYLSTFSHKGDTQASFKFETPMRIKSLTVDYRKLLEDLIQNALLKKGKYMTSALPSLLETSLRISRNKPGPGKYNYKIRKFLETFFPDTSGWPPPTRNPEESLATSAWHLTTKGPAQGLDRFPFVFPGRIPGEPFPGSRRILLQHLTGHTGHD